MGRKTYAAAAGDMLKSVTAEAARILTGDLAACSRVIQDSLEASKEADSWDDKEALVQRAIAIANAAARLGEAIAHIKSETRQLISVERNAPGTAIAPKSAPKNRTLSTANAAESSENGDAYPTKKRGGG